MRRKLGSLKNNEFAVAVFILSSWLTGGVLIDYGYVSEGMFMSALSGATLYWGAKKDFEGESL